MVPTLLSDAMLPFTIALALVIGLLVVELVSLLLGFAVGQAVDAAIDVDADLPDALEWIGLGQVPSMVLLPIFLTAFGVTGFLAQTATGSHLSPWIMAVPSLIVAIVATRSLGRMLGGIFNKNETSAVSSDALIGHTATITLGATRIGAPSQAKLHDKHGQAHYVLVEPVHEGETFDNGERVILVRREGPKYFVVADDPDALLRLDETDLVADVRREATK
ncbi:DUF1449 family protein [bacterium]|nr:MAG: DUF1449 family protein [bacterium]